MVIDPLLIQPFCGVGDLGVERLVARLNAATEPPSAADVRNGWVNRTIQQVWWQPWETPTAQRTIMGKLPFMLDRHGAHAALANFEHWLDKLAEPWIAARSALADLLACMEQQVRGDQQGDADHLIVMHYMNGNIVRTRELAIEFQLVPDEGYGSPAWERYDFVGMDMLKDERAAMGIGPNMQSSCKGKVRSRRVRFPVFAHRASAQFDPELMLILKRDRSQR